MFGYRPVRCSTAASGSTAVGNGGAASPARFITYGSIVVPNPERMHSVIRVTDPVRGLDAKSEGSSSSEEDDDDDDESAIDDGASDAGVMLFSPQPRADSFVPPPFNSPPYTMGDVKVHRLHCLSRGRRWTADDGRMVGYDAAFVCPPAPSCVQPMQIGTPSTPHAFHRSDREPSSTASARRWSIIQEPVDALLMASDDDTLAISIPFTSTLMVRAPTASTCWANGLHSDGLCRYVLLVPVVQRRAASVCVVVWYP